MLTRRDDVIDSTAEFVTRFNLILHHSDFPLCSYARHLNREDHLLPSAYVVLKKAAPTLARSKLKRQNREKDRFDQFANRKSKSGSDAEFKPEKQNSKNNVGESRASYLPPRQR